MCSYNLLDTIYNWMIDYIDYIGYYIGYYNCHHLCPFSKDIDSDGFDSDEDIHQGVMVDIDPDIDDEYCVVDVNGLP